MSSKSPIQPQGWLLCQKTLMLESTLLFVIVYLYCQCPQNQPPSLPGMHPITRLVAMSEILLLESTQPPLPGRHPTAL